MTEAAGKLHFGNCAIPHLEESPIPNNAVAGLKANSMSLPQSNFRNFLSMPPSRSNTMQAYIGIMTMNNLGLCLVLQLCLAFGLAGLFWPDKLMPLFDVLMFPWAASYRAIRANSVAAIGLAFLLLLRLLA